MIGPEEDPPIQFRLSHAEALIAVKTRVDDLSGWVKIGAASVITLLTLILTTLLMR